MSTNAKTSPIFLDVKDIISQPQDPYSSFFETEVKLHTVDKNLDNKDGLVVAGWLLFRDYRKNISDYVEITLTCLLGSYCYDIYPYLNNIELTVYTKRQLKPGGKPVVIAERYKAVYLLDRNMNTPSKPKGTKDDLNQRPPVKLTLQLLDRSSEVLRIKTVQGSFDKSVNSSNKDMSVGSFLQSLISAQVGKVSVEGKPVIDAVNIEPPSNTASLKSITIPSGVRLVDLPTHIQNKSIGVYAGGVGTYIQRYAPNRNKHGKVFFVYSLYDAAKYDKAENKIIFYSPPTSAYSSVDKTYTYEDNILKIVCDPIPDLEDLKESLLMSTGSGFRTTNANSMMKKPVVVTPTGPSFSKTGLNTAVVHSQREDGLNYAPVKGITGNNFVHGSEVLAKAGSYVKVKAYNLDQDFIYPGAACKIVYESEPGKLSDLYGVIHTMRVAGEQINLNMAEQYKTTQSKVNTAFEFEVFISK